MVDKKSKIFFTIFFSLIVISFVVTFYRYVILKDFDIFTDEEAFNEALIEE